MINNGTILLFLGHVNTHVLLEGFAMADICKSFSLFQIIRSHHISNVICVLCVGEGVVAYSVRRSASNCGH